MADLIITTPPGPCRGAAQHATCCEPSDKAACCGASAAGGTCGCAGGAGDDAADVCERVRDRYAAAAQAVAAGGHEGCACGPLSTLDSDGEQVFGASLYEEDAAAGAAGEALAGSLGCGVPTAVADLHPGETVLDLGSGAGATCSSAPVAWARRVRRSAST